MRDSWNSDSSMRMPMVTCAPWKPVSMKKAEPKGLVLSVRPSLKNSVNS